MRYPDASQMRYPDASKAWDPRAKTSQTFSPSSWRTPAAPAPGAASTTSSVASSDAPTTPAPGAGSSYSWAGLSAAESGELPPPANAAAAAGNSPLQVPQSAMVIGEPIPVIFGRRRGSVGGVLTFPKATEARFSGALATGITSSYHCVLGEGRMEDVQVRDVRCGECRIGAHSQQFSKRAGSWTPGAFSSTLTSTFTGGGGNYQGMSTIEFTATHGADSDNWRTAWNVFVRGGLIIERGRLLDSVVGPSDNLADLALWALQRSGRVPDALIDLPSFVSAAQFLEANGLWCNGEFNASGNLGDWLIRILPDFLLRETKVGGKFGLRPLVPVNSDGTINTGVIPPDWVLTEAAIIPDSFQREYSDAAMRRPAPMAMIWRQQADDTDVPIVRTLAVGDQNISGPVEQHDLSQYAAAEDHAARVGAYLYSRRTLSTHQATVQLRPGSQTGTIAEGDIVQVCLQVETSREAAANFNRFYVVESIGHSLSGAETLSLSHFPVTSEGKSIIALAVASAKGTGEILSSNRTGSGCDVNSSSSTTVPAKTTSGTPLYAAGTGDNSWAAGGIDIPGGVSDGTSGGPGGAGSISGRTYSAASGAFIDLFNGFGGAPSDSPPGPAQGGAKKFATGGGTIPPGTGTNDLGGDARCPYGYNRVDGHYTFNFIDVFANTYNQLVSFTATSFPNVAYAGKFYPTWGAAAGKAWDKYVVTWNDPTNGAQSANCYTIPPTSVFGSTFSAEFSITADSYSCTTDAGTAGPTVTAKLYKVVEGDTLASVSQKMYGTTARAADILAANPIFGFNNTSAVQDYWLMFPGRILTIPT